MDLSSFRAVIIFPQDLGLHKFTEHYALGMPIWVPTREWAYRLQMFVPWGMVSYSGSWRDATGEVAEDQESSGLEQEMPRLWPPAENWTGDVPDGKGGVLATKALDLVFPPWFNAQTVPYSLAKVSYWYQFGEFVTYPGVQQFDSVPALLDGMVGAD